MQGQLSISCSSLAGVIPMSADSLSLILTGHGFGVSSLLNALPDQVYIKDTHSRFVFVNTATARFMKKPAAELIGKTDYDLFPSGLADEFFAEEKKLLTSGLPLVNRESCITDPPSSLRWESTTKVPLRDDLGKIIGLIGINCDITDRKLAQEQLLQLNADLARSQVELLTTYDNLKLAQTQLIQAEKFESIGRLAAGVAHEVRNPLSIVSMGLGYIEDSLPKNMPVTNTVLNNMRDAILRADAIICELMDLSSPRRLDLKDEDVSKLAERALIFVRHELRHPQQIEVVREFAPDLPAQHVDRIHIEQVFVNLFINAIHAMPDGGRLTVRTLRDTTGDVVVEISDTGHGIAAENFKKVFEPFFTTKPSGIGSGMGLAVSKSIMTQHGGNLTLANLPSGGVCARMIFHNKKEADHGS